MPICPKCGKDNTQLDGSFCTFCGASLKNSVFASIQSTKTTTPNSVSSTEEKELRLEKATRRLERLGYIVAAELGVLAVLIVLLMFTFNLL